MRLLGFIFLVLALILLNYAFAVTLVISPTIAAGMTLGTVIRGGIVGLEVLVAIGIAETVK